MASALEWILDTMAATLITENPTFQPHQPMMY